jgi:hypothetical protein
MSNVPPITPTKLSFPSWLKRSASRSRWWKRVAFGSLVAQGVPLPDLMLAAEAAKERQIACLLMGLALFEIRHQGAQPSIRWI